MKKAHSKLCISVYPTDDQNVFKIKVSRKIDNEWSLWKIIYIDDEDIKVNTCFKEVKSDE